MKNKPEGEVKSELLSLVSIISIIVALAAICFLCLFVLNKMGVYSEPWFLSEDSSSGISLSPSGNKSEVLFDKNGSEIRYESAQASEQTLKNIIFSMTERSTFSVRASITYLQSEKEHSLFFESAADGDRYIMVIGDLATGEVRLRAECDGKTFSLTEGGATETLPCKGDACRRQYSLMPDFSPLIGDDSSIIYTGKDDDSYEVIFDSGSSGTVTDIKVSMSGRYLLSVKSYQNGRLLYSFETVSYSESYDEGIFSDT